MNEEMTPEEATQIQEIAENPIITPADAERWPLLEVPSQECALPLTTTDLEQLEKMNDILADLGDEAAGLAAVQVGYPRRMFLLNEDEDRRVFINPRIVSKSRETKKDTEGCLSLPNIPVYIARPKSVVLEFYDIAGNQQTEEFSGFWSRVIFHEMDHLDGILIIKRADEANPQQAPMKVFAKQQGFMRLTPHRRQMIAARRRRSKEARRARRGNR